MILPTSPIIPPSSSYTSESPPPRLVVAPRVPSYTLQISLSFFPPLAFLPALRLLYKIVLCLAVTSCISIVSFPLEPFFGSYHRHFYLTPLSTISGMPTLYLIYSEFCWLLILKNPHWFQPTPFFLANVHLVGCSRNHRRGLHPSFCIVPRPSSLQFSITGYSSTPSSSKPPFTMTQPSFPSCLHLNCHPRPMN